jgi:hypothetical protein
VSGAAGASPTPPRTLGAVRGERRRRNGHGHVLRQRDLTKAFAPVSIASGGTTTLTFTITNSAGNPAQSD